MAVRRMGADDAAGPSDGIHAWVQVLTSMPKRSTNSAAASIMECSGKVGWKDINTSAVLHRSEAQPGSPARQHDSSCVLMRRISIWLRDALRFPGVVVP